MNQKSTKISLRGTHFPLCSSGVLMPCPVSDSPSPRILIIDDDPDHREIINVCLRAKGYLCHEAADGVEGIIEMSQKNFDVVICDYHMPRMNGLEFIANVRMTQAISSIPIIFMTGHVDSGIFQQALDAGANAVLSKPYSFDELQAHLQLIVRGR